MCIRDSLLNRAQDLGVRFSWNTPLVIKPVPKEPPTLAGEPITCKWLIGADGAASRIRAWAGLHSAHLRSRRFGFRAHYRIAPWSTYVEVHWGPLGQAYITPIGPEEVCISAMSRHAGLRLTDILNSIPFLRDKLAAAPTTSTERGSLTVTRRLRRVTRGNVALIGDASGSVDAITGEGLALAFRQALLLADSLDRGPHRHSAAQDPHTSHNQSGSLALYESRHAAILALPQRMASLLLLLDLSLIHIWSSSPPTSPSARACFRTSWRMSSAMRATTPTFPSPLPPRALRPALQWRTMVPVSPPTCSLAFSSASSRVASRRAMAWAWPS